MAAGFDRRRCLVLIGSSLALVPFAHAGDDTKPAPAKDAAVAEKPETPLAAAARRARESGKPLLVMLARAEDHLDERGLQWAAVLDLAAEETCAELALCELAFASASQVNALWPKAALDDAKLPFGVLIRQATETFVALRFTGDPPKWEVVRDPKRERELADWLHAVGFALHRAIAPDVYSFENAARRVLGEKTGPRAEVQSLLARIHRVRMQHAAPAGAVWRIGFDFACSGGPCGMAKIADGSRHFLDLYVAPREGSLYR